MDNGLEKISQILTGEARKEREKILGESRKKAEQILKSCGERADSKKKEILEQAKREASSFRENELAKSRMDARIALLNIKDSIADEAFGQALEKLVLLKKKKDYQKIVLNMVCKSALEGEGELIVSEEDSGIFGKSLLSEINSRLAKKNAKVSLSKESRSMRGGFILSYPERGIELNKSFESLLKESREMNVPAVAGILFEAEG